MLLVVGHGFWIQFLRKILSMEEIHSNRRKKRR
jgi:hypothetical protein